MKKLFVPFALAALVACQSSSPPPAPEEPAAVRVESAELGIAIAALPDVFRVTSNEGGSLELSPREDLPEGRLWFDNGPLVEGGINLVDLVNGQRAEFEALPGGSFSGNNELLLPDGRPAYYSRGRFDEAGSQVEEFRIFAIHPTENRLLTVFYRYPAGTDSADRLNDLLLVIGEIEGVMSPMASGQEGEAS
jgi:hypothetical protein